MRRLLGLAALGLLLATGQFARAGVTHSPELTWYTLKSEHFRVHYHNGIAPLARRTVRRAEAIHGELTRKIGWEPETPTHIVVRDEIGLAGGFARLRPRKHIQITITPPDKAGSLADHNGWLETVLRHEYVHILHMDRAGGLPGAFRNLFGRTFLSYPNALQPLWATEGFAQKLEAKASTRAGRGQASYVDMVMRMEALAGPEPLDRVSSPGALWPGGSRPYHYGIAFFTFLEERFGKNAYKAWLDQQSQQPIPFRYSPALRAATGMTKTELWSAFRTWLRERHRPTIQQIRDAGPQTGQALTEHGYRTGQPHADGQGRIVYTRNTGEGPPTMRRVNPATGERKKLAELRPGGRLAVSSAGGIRVAQPAACGNVRRYYDVFRWVPGSGDLRRLTTCGRYRRLAWGPAGESLFAIRHAGSRPQLVRLDPDSGDQEAVLWEGELLTQLGSMDVARSGDRLIAARWSWQRGWHLAEFDLPKRSWSVVTARRAMELQPSYGRSGSIFYTADYGGIYNVQQVNRETGKVRTLSRAIGGAFAPEPVRNGAHAGLAFLNYSAEGFDLNWFSTVPDGRPANPGAPGASAEMAPEPRSPKRLGNGGDPSRYMSWRHVAPTSWFPKVAYTAGESLQTGIQTAGSDPLRRHRYGLTLGYDWLAQAPFGRIDYSFDRFKPIPKLSAEQSLTSRFDSGGEFERLRRTRRIAAELALPFLSLDRRLSLHLGAQISRRQDISLASEQAEPVDQQGNPVGLAGIWNSTKRWPRSISASHGFYGALAVEHESLWGNPSYSGPVGVADGRAYLGLGGQHVLQLRQVLGYGSKRPKPFELGGISPPRGPPGLVGGVQPTNPLHQRSFPLRGYPAGSVSGTAATLTSAEYRFPLARLERGLTLVPLNLETISGRIAVEAGQAWPGDRLPETLRSGAAAELVGQVWVGYRGQLTVRFGAAHGRETQLYVTLGGGL